jgi:hypothetical protein
MVCYHTINANFGIFWKTSGWKILVYICIQTSFGISLPFCCISWPFGILVAIMVYFSRFGVLHQEKSGNLALFVT